MSHVIAAVSTGASVSAIGIIRLSGDGCIAVADKVFTLNSGKSLVESPDRRLVLGTPGEVRESLKKDNTTTP